MKYQGHLGNGGLNDAEPNEWHCINPDAWQRFNDECDPRDWTSGQFFSCGDGCGRRGKQSWHVAIFYER